MTAAVVMHFRIDYGFTACNYYVPASRMTTDPTRVRCGTCKRSRAFRAALTIGELAVGETIANEEHLQRLVAALCHVLCVGHYHPSDSRRSEAGFPDSVMWAAGGMLFRELKSENGRPSRAQLRVGAELRAAGADWSIWRPEDWHSGRIEREIRGILAP